MVQGDDGRGDAVGKSCRLLQGEQTEAESVGQMLAALRERRPCNVVVTNYKKGGERFRNALTLHPMNDSDGAYRYVIGLTIDADAYDPVAAGVLPLVRKMLPDKFPASLAPSAHRMPQIGKQSTAAHGAGAIGAAAPESTAQAGHQYKIAAVRLVRGEALHPYGALAWNTGSTSSR